ncbi:hypothetical protein LRH25_20655 [Ideonella azotifigens]|uniref:DUF922 domain-containing protein n=1 Tax=Ideonella azotifigens TaxID=513160 RepID=A0ABP3VB57_9BURK|nr:hypothetical protein [Ideonella azotifigens]MCD2342743.1 hypothetical protein [Ideonella azotifigens]
MPAPRAHLALLIGLSTGVLSAPSRGAELPPCSEPIRYAADWFPAPELDHGKRSAEVTALGNAGQKKTGKGVQLGHVMVQTQLSVEPQASCAGIVVRLAFVKPVLRIASEFPEDSCSYARVLNHEHTHVRIWRDIAAQFRQLRYPWPERASSATVLNHARQALATLTRAQDEFDSPEEYARNNLLCGGEIQRLVKLPSMASAGG